MRSLQPIALLDRISFILTEHIAASALDLLLEGCPQMYLQDVIAEQKGACSVASEALESLLVRVAHGLEYFIRGLAGEK